MQRRDGGTGNDDPLLEVDFESGQEDNAANNFNINKLPDGRLARDNNQAVVAHVDNIYNQHDLNQDGQIDMQVA